MHADLSAIQSAALMIIYSHFIAIICLILLKRRQRRPKSDLQLSRRPLRLHKSQPPKLDSFFSLLICFHIHFRFLRSTFV